MKALGIITCFLAGAIVGGCLLALIKAVRRLRWSDMIADVIVGLVAWVITSACYIYLIDQRHFEEAKSVVERVEAAQTKIRKDTEVLTASAQKLQARLDEQLEDFRDAVTTTNELLHVVQIAGVNTLRSQVKQGEKVNHP